MLNPILTQYYYPEHQKPLNPMKKCCFWVIFFSFCGSLQASHAQSLSTPSGAYQDTSFPDAAILRQLPGGYLHKVTSKTRRFNRQITKHTARALHRLHRQEEKLHGKLFPTDSFSTPKLLDLAPPDLPDSLLYLGKMIKQKTDQAAGMVTGEKFIPYLDTLENMLHFLDRYKDKLLTVNEPSLHRHLQRLPGALRNLQALKGKLGQLDDIQQYLSRQQKALNRSLGAYSQAFNSYRGKFEKEVSSYRGQIANYKELWQHPKRAEAKALQIFNQLPAFDSFMKEHSRLASLFVLPTPGNNAHPLAHLQTRAMIAKEIQQSLQGMDDYGTRQIQQRMTEAKQQLEQLKSQLPGNGATAESPGFTSKNKKNKTLLQRLEYGVNIQFENAGGYLPTISNLAGQIAYKFSDKGTAGLGAAFKLGWGSDIRKINLTPQGFGLRSFLDYRLRNSLYITGGYEFNFYRNIPEIPSLISTGTRSALLGIERKYELSSPFRGKKGSVKGNMMLLFNFLYKKQIPNAQPVIFRIGYNF